MSALYYNPSLILLHRFTWVFSFWNIPHTLNVQTHKSNTRAPSHATWFWHLAASGCLIKYYSAVDSFLMSFVSLSTMMNSVFSLFTFFAFSTYVFICKIDLLLFYKWYNNTGNSLSSPAHMFGTFSMPNNNLRTEFTVRNDTKFVTLLDFPS